jgi:hypothetical protein
LNDTHQEVEMLTRSWFRIASFIVAAAASVAAGGTAHASKIATSMWNCYPAGNLIDPNNPGTNNNFGEFVLASFSSTTSIGLWCNVDNFSATPISTVTVDAYKQTGAKNTAVDVRACVAFTGGFGGSCGSYDSNTSSGIVTIQPALTAWTNNPTAYRFLNILVTRPSSGANTVFGYRQD